MIDCQAIVDDRLSKAIAAFEKTAREEREKKTVGQATLTVDFQQGGITDTRIGVVRKIK